MITKYDSETLFAALDQLTQLEPERQGFAAWRYIARAENTDIYQVALDYAVEHGLIPPELVTLMRSDTRGGAANASWINPVDGSEMIWIGGGPFIAGRDRQGHSEGFFLARHPVTNAQFTKFLEATDYETQSGEAAGEFLQHWTDGCPEGKENHPVVFVNYFDALHYCRWAGLMLPTECSGKKPHAEVMDESILGPVQPPTQLLCKNFQNFQNLPNFSRMTRAMLKRSARFALRTAVKTWSVTCRNGVIEWSPKKILISVKSQQP